MRFLIDEESCVLVDYAVFNDFFNGHMTCWADAMNHLITGDELSDLTLHLKNYTEKSSDFAMRRDGICNYDRGIFNYDEEISYQIEFLNEVFRMQKDAVQRAVNERPDYLSNKCSIKTQNSDEKAGLSEILHNIILEKFRNSMGFLESQWQPRDPFERLCSEIKSKGALIANGHFHRMYYTADAKHTAAMLGENKVYQYPVNTAISHIPVDNPKHAILIVAAKKLQTGKKQELVYYIDPTSRSKQLYVMSYKMLQEKIFNAHSEHRVASGGCFNVPMYTKGPFLIASSDYAKVQNRRDALHVELQNQAFRPL